MFDDEFINQIFENRYEKIENNSEVNEWIENILKLFFPKRERSG